MTGASTSNVWRDFGVVVGMILLTLTLPVAIYGYLSWQQFDYFSLSYFVPHELARAELANPTVARIVSLPLVEMNMTSGHILSNNVHADARSAGSINHDRTYDWSGTRRTP
jgi:hypothetical protein